MLEVVGIRQSLVVVVVVAKWSLVVALVIVVVVGRWCVVVVVVMLVVCCPLSRH